MDLDQRYKDIDVDKLFDEKFSEIGFEVIPEDEWQKIYAQLEKMEGTYAPKYLAQLKKASEGREKGYWRKVGHIVIFAWTSWVPSKKCFKKMDRLWVGMFEARNPAGFFAIPMNRTGDFIERFINTVRVYTEKALHWPHCSECQKMLFWQELFTYSGNEEEIGNTQFPLRYVVCGNKKCSTYGKEIMLINDIPLDSKKDMTFFAAPFNRYAKEVARNAAKGIFKLPRRLWRWLTKHGFVVRRQLPFDDTENELKGRELDWSDYHDLDGQDRNDLHIDEPPTPDDKG